MTQDNNNPNNNNNKKLVAQVGKNTRKEKKENVPEQNA
jgi:hypothetical protein